MKNIHNTNSLKNKLLKEKKLLENKNKTHLPHTR